MEDARKRALELRSIQQKLMEVHSEFGETEVFPFRNAAKAAALVADMAEFMEDGLEE